MKNYPSNCRTLSILAVVFSKIYECAVHSRLVYFLDANNLFDGVQHGFRSVSTAGIDLAESIIIYATDNSWDYHCDFLELSKAFGSVFHPILLYSLQRFGTVGLPIWIFW